MGSEEILREDAPLSELRDKLIHARKAELRAELPEAPSAVAKYVVEDEIEVEAVEEYSGPGVILEPEQSELIGAPEAKKPKVRRRSHGVVLFQPDKQPAKTKVNRADNTRGNIKTATREKEFIDYTNPHAFSNQNRSTSKSTRPRVNKVKGPNPNMMQSIEESRIARLRRKEDEQGVFEPEQSIYESVYEPKEEAKPLSQMSAEEIMQSRFKGIITDSELAEHLWRVVRILPPGQQNKALRDAFKSIPDMEGKIEGWQDLFIDLQAQVTSGLAEAIERRKRHR